MDRYTITFIAPFGLGQKTTVWARILPLAQHLAAQGHTISILIPPWDTPTDVGQEWDEKGVHIRNVTLKGGLPFTFMRLLRAMHERQPHIVHIIKPRAYAGFVQWWLWQQRKIKRQKNPPHIVLDMDDWEQAWNEINQYPWPISQLLTWQEEWGIRHADGITAASHWLEKQANLYAPETPALYLPNGITQETPATHFHSPYGNMERELPVEDKAGGKTVLLFSRFIEVEPTWFADFWISLQQKMPNVQLLVAGRGLSPEREEQFKSLIFANTQTVSTQVRWLGFVPPETVPSLYAQADCAIFPAENTPLNQAKCSVRLTKALLHGTPVVASAVGEQANYGADGAAYLVDANATPEQFAQAVAYVLENPETQRQLGKKAINRLLAKYQWAFLGEQLERFYAEIIQRSQSDISAASSLQP